MTTGECFEAVPRIALTIDEAAAALAMSRDSFERHVMPDLPIIRLGRMRRVACSALEEWAGRAGERTIP